MIYLTKKDDRNIQLHGSSMTKTNIQKIKKKFSYRPKGKYNPIEKKYDFMPITSVFDSKEMTIPIRFLFPLSRFLNEEGIEKTVHPDLIEVSSKDEAERRWNDFLDNDLISIIKPYKHQQRAVLNALVRKKTFFELATSGGKSLIIYAIGNILRKDGKKILVITDTATLVNQLKADCISYSTDKDLESEIVAIHSTSKDDKYSEDVSIFISTYKSMSNLPPEYFQKFDCLIVDEAHKALAPSVMEVIDKCWHCEYIIGMSGKVKTDAESRFKTTQLFGEILSIINAKELIERDMATPLSIVATKMKRPHIKFHNGYREYIDYVCQDQRRLHYIIEDVLRDGENMILLFNHRVMGENILNAVKTQSKKKGKKYIIEYIDGTVPVGERDRIKALFEKNNNVILVASYRTIATGVNAPNLRGIALVEPMKAELTIVQAIGRTLRLNKGKEIAKVYDYGDSYGWGYRHMKQRLKTYTTEGHDFELNEVFIPL